MSATIANEPGISFSEFFEFVSLSAQEMTTVAPFCAKALAGARARYRRDFRNSGDDDYFILYFHRTSVTRTNDALMSTMYYTERT